MEDHLAANDRVGSGTGARKGARLQIVELIRAAGQIARIDIAKRTGLSPATVTSITQQLIQADLVDEVAPVDLPDTARRGRPRVALKVHSDAHLVAGVKVSARTLSAVVVDFQGNMLAEHTMPLPASTLCGEMLVSTVSKALDTLMAGVGKSRTDLSGLGLGMSGFVDGPSGVVHWSASLSERNLHACDLFTDVLDFPVFIDNDANLVAKAEQLFGEARGVSDFLVVTIEQGVGMGVVIDGQIYRGTRGTGAEFGHTKVHLDGALCRCGQRGCLEAYVADYALLREAGTLIPADQGTPEARLDALFLAAHKGEPIAQSILNRASRMFAMGLANLVNIFDPKLIILSGEQMSHEFLYTDEVITAMKSLVINIDAPPPEVRIHKWGDLMWAKGAAAFAMEGVTDLAVRAIVSDV